MLLYIQAMNTSEKFCLKWNDFQENIRYAFRTMKFDTDFVDVTLTCEDGNQIFAHKFVLTSSSPFFHKLLLKNKHPHPLIYMRGVKSNILKSIVDFLYDGEANIIQEDLDNFLLIAEELSLKGLTREETEESGNGYNPPNMKSNAPKSPNMKMYEEDNIEDLTKDLLVEGKIYQDKVLRQNQEKSLVLFDGMGDFEEKIQSMIIPSQNTSQGRKIYECTVCGKQDKLSHLKEHIESNHIGGVLHSCDICGKTSRSRNSLFKHKAHHRKLY